MIKFYFVVFVLVVSCGLVNAQAPNINYPATQTYTIGNTITPVGPVNTGGSVLPVVSLLTSGTNQGANMTIDPSGNFIFSSAPSNYGEIVYRLTPAGTITQLSKYGYHVSNGFGGYDVPPDFYMVGGIATDAAGNIYVSDGSARIIRKISTAGSITTIAGSGAPGNADGVGTAASFYSPGGLAVDASGNIYVADTYNYLIRKITPGGSVTTIAGNGINAITDGTGTAASFTYPQSLAFDKAGNLYVFDGGSLRVISAGNVVKTISNNGNAVYVVGTGNFVVDAYKNIYTASYNAIQRVTPTGTVSIFAGTGAAGNTNGTGDVATFNNLTSLAIDGAGNIYAADAGNNAIRKLTPAGYTISPALPGGLSFDNSTGLITGTPTVTWPVTAYTVTAYNSNGSSNAYCTIGVNSPQAIVFPAIPSPTYGDLDFSPTATASSNLSVNYASSNSAVATIINNKVHIIGVGTTTITASQPGDIVSYAAATNVTQTLVILPAPLTISANNARKLSGAANPLFFATYDGFVNNESSTVLTSFPVVSTTATASSPPGSYPITVSGAAAHNYIMSYVPGSLDISGPPPAISYAGPLACTAGTAIIALSPTNTGGTVPASIYGKVTTFAGSGSPGNINATGSAASFTYPSGVAVDASGNIFVTDISAYVIRKITPAGVVTTFAGNGNQASVDGVGTSASFNYPSSITIDGVGNLYVTDENSNKIRKVTSAGVVSTYAGTGASGSSNGAALTQATFWLPHGIAVDGEGNVYVAERGNNLVREITPGGMVSTLAGNGSAGSANGTATVASFNAITGLVSDYNGNLYVADGGNNMIRKISSGGTVSTLAGTTVGGSSDGAGASAGFYAPAGIALDFAGNLYVTDQTTNIRQINASGLVTTLAGKGYVDTTNAVGSLAGFTNPQGLAVDFSGNIYVADAGNYKIRKIIANGFSVAPSLPAGLTFDNTTGTISGTPNAASLSVTYKVTAYNTSGSSSANLTITVAAEAFPKISYSTPQNFTVGTTIAPMVPVNTGGGIQSGLYLNTSLFAGGSHIPGANGTGAGANFSSSFGLAVDAVGNVYVADTYNNSIRKITPSGVSSTIAGTGQQGADDGAGNQATFYNPYGVAVDGSGNVYVADRGNYLIRKITPAGVVSTFAGSGSAGSVDATGTAASFRNPQDVVVDKSGNVFVLEATGIRQITPAGVVTTLVANAFADAMEFAIDASGNFYVADYSGSLVKKVTSAGVVTTIGSYSTFLQPSGIAVDNSGNIFVSDLSLTLQNRSYGNRITRINTDGTLLPLVVGYGGSLAIDKFGNLYSRPNTSLGLITKTVTTNYYTVSPSLPAGLNFNPTTGIISGTPLVVSAAAVYVITAHNSTGINSTNINIAVSKAAAPQISYSTSSLLLTKGLAITPLKPINTGGAVPANPYGQTTTLAGDGSAGFVNGHGLSASFNGPYGLVVDAAGNLFVTDMYNSVVRKITPAGFVSTYAGSGVTGSVDGANLSASFGGPAGITIDGSGNLFVRESGNGYIKEVTTSGFVSTLSISNYLGNVRSNSTFDILFNKAGNLYETYNNQVRMVNLNTSQITVLAGSVNLKSGFKNGQDTAARFFNPKALVFDAAGNIYVADDFNNQIRKISTSNLVTTFAGNTTPGAVNGTGAAASFYNPSALVFDASYNLYVADGANNMIRKITPAGVVTTLAGNPTQGSADGIGSAASFWGPQGLAIDGTGNLYVADGNNNRIRKVITTGYTISPALPSGLTFNAATGTISGTPDSTYSTGSFTVTAYNNGGSSSAIISLGVSQAQTITFNPIAAITTNGADFDPGATTNSGLPITYSSSNTAVATVVNGLIHVVGIGTSTITASQAGNAVYLSASASRTLTVVKPVAQTITFKALPGQTYGSADLDPGATASSGLQPFYTSSDTTIATIINNKVHIIAAGTVSITATQPGNGTYAKATSISQSLVIGKASQAITFAALPGKNYGAVDFAPGAISSSGLAVTFTSGDTTIAKIIGGSIHILSAGSVSITAIQNGNNNYLAAATVVQSLTISKVGQTISFSAIAAKTYGTADFSGGAYSSAGLIISYTSSDTTVAKIVAGLVHITGVGQVTITAVQAGNMDYTAGTPVSQTFTVSKGGQTITFNALASVQYGTPDFSPGASSTSGLPITYTVNDTTTAKIKNGLIHIVKAGTAIITASQPGNANYLAATKNVVQTLTISKTTQIITFTTIPPAAFGGASITPSAASNSGLAVSFASSDTTIIKVSGPSLLIKGVGSTVITATQAGNVDYVAAPTVGQTVVVGKGSQTITFAALVSKVYGSADYNIAATASSKLAVTFSSSDTTIAKVTGTLVHIVSAGTVTITANQGGSALYNAAPATSQQLVIAPTTQVITFAGIPAKTYGTADFALTATSTSKLPVGYASSNPLVVTIVNGSVHIVGAGTSVITASQAGGTDYKAATAVAQTLTVNKAALTIKANNQVITYGTVIPPLTVTYTGFVNGETQAVLTVLPKVSTTATANSPAGTYIIKDSAAVAANYSPIYSTGTLTINKASQAITFATLPAGVYGGPSIVPSATSSSGLAVSFASSDTTIIKVSGSNLLIKGVGKAVITASQAGNVNYLAAPAVPQTLTVGKGSQTITFAALVSKVYGAADYNVAATASSKLAVTFSSSDTSIAKVTGTLVHIVSAGTVTIIANQAGSAQYNAAPSVGQQLVITPATQVITFTGLGAKTYGIADVALTGVATSKLAVSYTSSNPAVSTIVNGSLHIIAAGTAVITASQAGNKNYQAATSINQTLTVLKATLTIKANNQTMTAGTAIPALTASYTGFVNGDAQASLSTLPTVVTKATSSSPAGTYPITVSGAVAVNYNIVYTAGILTITPVTGGNIVTKDLVAEISVNDAPAVVVFEPSVKAAVSPNGDGINDVLIIDNINNFPDNKLLLMNRAGVKIFEAEHYDNMRKAFDGRASMTGVLQPAGTYFYILEYKNKGALKHKTGFIVLKY